MCKALLELMNFSIYSLLDDRYRRQNVENTIKFEEMNTYKKD